MIDMLVVNNGYKLYTAQPSSHDYRFQASPSPVIRNITAPFNPTDDPPYMLNDQGSKVYVTEPYDRSKDPTPAECTAGTITWREENSPQTIHTLTSGVHTDGYYYPQVDGVLWTNTARLSTIPLTYAMSHTQQNGCRVQSDGSIYYVIDDPWIAVLGINLRGEQFFRQRDNILSSVQKMMIAPTAWAQQDYQYTVSGS